MQTQTSEPGEQDLGQQTGTDGVPRLFFLPEVLPQDLVFGRAQGPSALPGRFRVWLMTGMREKALKNPRMGLTQRTALSFRALVSAPPGGVWPAAPVCKG